MEKIKLFYILFLLCNILLFPLTGSAKESIILALEESPPLKSEKMENFGCLPEIVTAAFNSVAVEVEYAFISPLGAHERAKRGEFFNALVGWVWSKEREKFFYFSDPIFVHVHGGEA